MTPSVPAKLELVKICVEVLLPESVERSQSPTLQIREHAMDALETDVCRKSVPLARVLREMLPVGNAHVRAIGIRIDGTSRCRVGDDERLDVAGVRQPVDMTACR